jgi:hypothetical protein
VAAAAVDAVAAATGLECLEVGAWVEEDDMGSERHCASWVTVRGHVGSAQGQVGQVGAMGQRGQVH